MEISYQRHPAESKYLSKQTSKDTTNDPRTEWNIGAKENINEVNLDMNVNKPGGTDVGGGSVNDGYANYQMNIFGTIKKIITANIINPSKFTLETGDIVQFSLDINPFGDDWSNYFMITETQRSPGQLSITCREVS